MGQNIINNGQTILNGQSENSNSQDVESNVLFIVVFVKDMI